MKIRSRKPHLLLLLVLLVGGYLRFGSVALAIGLFAFILYEMLMPPPRHRVFGPDQIQEAVDNRFGHFGRAYREEEPEPDHLKIGRNDPCPCGSGAKYKRCCGRPVDDEPTSAD